MDLQNRRKSLPAPLGFLLHFSSTEARLVTETTTMNIRSLQRERQEQASKES